MIKDSYTHIPRKGCKDVWNAFMCNGARFSLHDIPFCETTATSLPCYIITWEEAKDIYRRAIRKGDKNFQHLAFVCWYIDDYKFDSARGIWHNSRKALEILRHFAGAITPDFSTFQDFPEPLKYYNTFRMRAFGHWLGINGIHVINNVRWGTPESWWYCFDGIPENSIVAIGTVGGSPFRLKDRKRFVDGLTTMVNRLHPHTIIVYGSANYPCFNELKEQGILIVSYPSCTSQAFERRRAM